MILLLRELLLDCFIVKLMGSVLLKSVFVTFCFRDALSNMVIFFRNMFKYVHAMSLINYDVIVNTLLIIHLLLIAGDIELNPGTIAYRSKMCCQYIMVILEV
jgi:hypothetical protein